MSDTLPILYSFRRCPYAMRARLALAMSGIRCELREVVLRDKPPELIEASPKATVPVMILSNGTVLEESLDIMMWSHTPDADGPTAEYSKLAHHELVKTNDGEFKHHLDRYKYPNRYAGAVALEHRTQAEAFLKTLNDTLAASPFLDSQTPTELDYAIAPFIRQFANTDRAWFDTAPYPHLQAWLNSILSSPIFLGVMKKYPRWSAGDPVTYFDYQASDS